MAKKFGNKWTTEFLKLHEDREILIMAIKKVIAEQNKYPGWAIKRLELALLEIGEDTK